MRLASLLLASLLMSGLAACAPTIATINARPAKYYQKKVTLRGQIARMQALPAETLLELADAHGARILVRTAGAVEHGPGDWVRVDGILVPEARVGDRVLYDVVDAERIRGARAPRLRNLM
jgi:hypothetical protein